MNFYCFAEAIIGPRGSTCRVYNETFSFSMQCRCPSCYPNFILWMIQLPQLEIQDVQDVIYKTAAECCSQSYGLLGELTIVLFCILLQYYYVLTYKSGFLRTMIVTLIYSSTFGWLRNLPLKHPYEIASWFTCKLPFLLIDRV